MSSSWHVALLVHAALTLNSVALIMPTAVHTQALSRHTSVPVPRPLALCEDVAVLGTPFYLMDFVEGQVLNPGGRGRGGGEG